jgi:hypothetical protein
MRLLAAELAHKIRSNMSSLRKAHISAILVNFDFFEALL